jgi:hypothetical protein
MRFLTHGALIGVAVFVALTGPISAQRVCQANDTDCFNSRMHSQREQTLRRLQADNQGRHDGKVRTQRNSGWEQYRQDRIHERSSPVCDVKPIISGEGTRAVPTC